LACLLFSRFPKANYSLIGALSTSEPENKPAISHTS
jgi:hypothetical protein